MSDIPDNVIGMRVVGAISLVASVVQVIEIKKFNFNPYKVNQLNVSVQIGVAGAAYGMTSWKVGAWWAGVSAFIASIFALISTNK